MVTSFVKDGNIFDANTDAIVNPVNCVGIMGKGLASEFKNRYPLMFKEYKELCRNGSLRPGTLYIWKEEGFGGKTIINFPTKVHWKDKSEMIYISAGLDYFCSHYQKYGISSVAFPALGCGLGGLDFSDVMNVMISKLDPLPILVHIYYPHNV